MVVLEKPEAGNAWMFVKPFTKSMWAVTIAIFLYNGLIVWLIEKAGDEELKSSSFSSQFGSLVWLSVTALFPINGKREYHAPIYPCSGIIRFNLINNKVKRYKVNC